MRISMQILSDRLRQNYPDCCMGEMSDEMNLKRPLFYQSGTDFRKNKVYVFITLYFRKVRTCSYTFLIKNNHVRDE